MKDLHAPEYRNRVYAGVLGKIIGVYVGRPFEQWPQAQIEAKFGEIDRYVAEEAGVPLVVTDDDISGTFTFFRAFEDHGFDPDLTPEQIGNTWMNYIIENRAILWWGGVGMSTEHTAFRRMQDGVKAPESGSIALNGQVVAEQIGAQIFIDAWGLMCPGDPVLAADFARRAGSVSHDGEAVYGAQMVAAMVAAAFTHDTPEAVIEAALPVIPADCLIRKCIDDVWESFKRGDSWRTGLKMIQAKWGYDTYGGGCHILPNHALVIHGLLHGRGDFRESMRVTNTCAYDTDCNAANVGCIVGVMRGLAAFEGEYDWRGPVADRMFLPTADGGRAITDAVQEADAIIRAACALQKSAAPAKKAKFNFEFPGSVQGFEGEVLNVEGALQVQAPGAWTRTFTTKSDREMGGYGVLASPTLYSGQVVTLTIQASSPFQIGLEIATDTVETILSEPYEGSADVQTVRFTVPDTNGAPIQRLGVLSEAAFHIHKIDFSGTPNVRLGRHTKGEVWRTAWVSAVDEWNNWGPEDFRIIQNRGTGQILCGTHDWANYSIETTVTPRLCESTGIAVNVQGLRRRVALRIRRDGLAVLESVFDDNVVQVAAPFEWNFDDAILLRLEANGEDVRAFVNGAQILETRSRLTHGGVALLVEYGRVEFGPVTIAPL